MWLTLVKHLKVKRGHLVGITNVARTERVLQLESSSKDQIIDTYKAFLLRYVTSGHYFRLGRFIG